MKQLKKLARVLIVAAFSLGMQNALMAQESKAGHSHAKAEMHGGSAMMTKQYHFEVVFKSDAIQVYLYDGEQKPLSAKGVKGEVALKFTDGKSQTLPLEYVSPPVTEKGEPHEGMAHEKTKKAQEGEHPHGEEKGHAEEHPSEAHGHSEGMMKMDYLQAKADLSKVKAKSMKATFSVKGLPNEKEREASFTATFPGLQAKKESHDEHQH